MVHLPVMLIEEMQSVISFRTNCNMVGMCHYKACK